jgi:hypothetical protein
MAHHDARGRHEEPLPGIAAVVAALPLSPNVNTAQVTNPVLLDQARVFAEVARQAQPLAAAGTPAVQHAARAVRDGTALPTGLSADRALRYASQGADVEALFRGAHPGGKAAEIVTAADYRALHAGNDPGIVNPPERVATNVADIRLAPDPSSRKDLLFAFEKPNGEWLWKHSGQVKTGGSQYVADSLVEMANTPGYGKVAYVDASLVNADGTARVGRDAFTEAQARRLQLAKVRLRGIPKLQERSQLLLNNVKASKADGLDPLAREELRLLRNDIAAAYEPGGVAGRLASAAATGAAAAAVVSLVIQLATEGKMDARTFWSAARTGAAYGAAGAAADASLYHLGTKALDLQPEAAQRFANNGVAVGFSVIAIAADLVSEIRSAHRGDITSAAAASGFTIKAALDLLPLVMAPLGLPALPIVVAAQVGGRWMVGKARQADRVLAQAVAQHLATADSVEKRSHALAEAINAECDATDALFDIAMGSDHSGHPRLRLLNARKEQ